MTNAPAQPEQGVEAVAEYAAVCKELGCIAKPGVALRFIQDLRKQLSHAHERQDWLLRTWDDATITERQELDRMRRGWGPTTPTERTRRLEDVQAAMRCISSAMSDITLSEEEAEVADEETNRRLSEAHERLRKHYAGIIVILHRIQDEPIERPDLPREAPAAVAWQVRPLGDKVWHITDDPRPAMGYEKRPLFASPAPAPEAPAGLIGIRTATGADYSVSLFFDTLDHSERFLDELRAALDAAGRR